MFDQNNPQEGTQDYNEAAAYAAQYAQTRGGLNLGPSLQDDGAGSFELAKPETDDDVMKFYEENPNLYLDLSQPDAEQTWGKLVRGMKNRHDDIWETIKDAGSAIAEIPFGLVEGMAESKDLRTWTASTVEGAIRGLRDMYGMVAESENPTSALFNFKSALKAIVSGKPSQNWQEEAQQWNEARKFLYHSQKMSMGDETLLDQFDFLHASNQTKETWRSFINPKIAHAMAFMGLEIPSMLAAPFTAGASAEAGLLAGITESGVQAMRAEKANWLMKVGNSLARHQANFENMAAKFTQRMAGHTANALGTALEPFANLAEGAIGGTIKTLSERSGISESAISNATQASLAQGLQAVGGGQIRQTVGFLGSMGLRSTSELLKEIGEANLNLASGVVNIKDIAGLTVLERVAINPLMSPSAQMMAKVANVIVDPVIQMSTAALKNGYKDALIFGGLGFANDNVRGAAGGAATGMVWGGYSGAFRHAWSNVNGGMQHAITLRNFDDRVLPVIEASNVKMGSHVRMVLSEVDALKSTKASANARMAIQIGYASTAPSMRGKIVFHLGNKESFVQHIISENKKVPSRINEIEGSRASFMLLYDIGTTGKSEPTPAIFINRASYRPVDIGHEIMAHFLSYNLHVKGMIGDIHRQMIGDKENGGVFKDDELLLDGPVRRYLAEYASTKSMSDLFISGGHGTKDEIGGPKYLKFVEDYYKRKDSYGAAMKMYKGHLKKIREDARLGGDQFWNAVDSQGNRYTDYVNDRDVGETFRHIFEENVGQYSEGLFLHTNLAKLTADASSPLRLFIESIRTNIFARQWTQMEMAGIVAKHDGVAFTKDGTPLVQAFVYDDGKYYRHAEMDGLIQRMVRTAMDLDGQSIEMLSPERIAMESRRYGKDYLLNPSGTGARLLSTKQQNDMLSERAKKAIDTLESIDPKHRPEIVQDEFGNKTVDMYRMSDEAYAALEAAGVLDKHASDIAKSFRDTMLQWEASGYKSGNVYAADYWGNTQRQMPIRNLILERIRKPDTQITHRLFVPYELKLTYRTTDSNGKQLKAGRGGMVATVVDMNAIFRRQIKNWEKPNFRATFRDLAHFQATFHDYMLNMMKEPSLRVPTADLFRAEFGKDAEKVRDMMYETFGGRKRGDESYINVPSNEGYSSNPEHPDYPIHSMKLELIIGAEKMPTPPFPFNFKNSYEPLRRNASVMGFTVINEKGNRRRNGQGFEIFSGKNRHKLYSPFGEQIGVYDTIKKAIKASNKYLGRMDEADVMPMPTDIESVQNPNGPNALSVSNKGTIIPQMQEQGIMKSVGFNKNGEVVSVEHEIVSAEEALDLLRVLGKYQLQDKKDSTKINILQYAGEGFALSFADFIAKHDLPNAIQFAKETGAIDPRKLKVLTVLPSEMNPEGGIRFDVGIETSGMFFKWLLSDNTLKSPTLLIDHEGLLSFLGNDREAFGNALSAIIRSQKNAADLCFSQYGHLFSSLDEGAPTASAISSLNHLARLIEGMESKNPVVLEEIKLNAKETRRQAAERFEKLAPAKEQIEDQSLTINEYFKKSPFSSFKSEVGYAREQLFPAGKNNRKFGYDKSDAFKLTEKRKATEVVQIFSKIADFYKALSEEDSVVYALPNENGELVSLIVPSEKFNPREKIDAIWSIVESQKDKLYRSYLGALVHQYMHGYVQLVGKALDGSDDMLGQIGRRNLLFVGNEGTIYEHNAFVRPNYASDRIFNLPKNAVVAGPIGKHAGIGISESSGSKIAMGKGKDKNALTGGFFGGGGESGPIEEGVVNNSPANELSLPASAMGSNARALASKTVGRLLNDCLSSKFHIKMAEMFIMAELGDAYDSQITSLKASSKEDYAYLQGLAQIASSSKNDAAIMMALKACQVERTLFGGPMKHALSQLVVEQQKKTIVAGLASELEKYWSVPDKDGKAVGSGKLQSVYGSLLAYKLYGKEVSYNVESFDSLVRQIKKESDVERLKGAIDEANRINPIMKSVASVRNMTEDVKRELVDKGWLRVIKIGGKDVPTFEFSDKDASLKLSMVQGQQHLLPWAFGMGSMTPEERFQDYMRWMEASEKAGISTYSKQPYGWSENMFSMKYGSGAIIRDKDGKIISTHNGPSRPYTDSVTLGQIFHHPELFRYFPELADIRVEFANFFGAYTFTDAYDHQAARGEITQANEPRWVRQGTSAKWVKDPKAEMYPVSLPHRIVLGIRSISGYAMDETLALGREADSETIARAASLLNKEAYRSALASENPLASMLLHEVQHILQYHTGIETPAYNMLGKVGKEYRKAFSDLLGVWNILPSIEEQDILGNSKLVTKQNIEMLARSPYFTSHLGRTRHIISGLWQSTSAYVNDRIRKGELPSAEYGEKLIKLSQTSVISGASVSGESLLRFYNELMDMHNSLALDSRDYALSMAYDTQFRVAQAAVSMITDLANLNAEDPVHFKTSILSMQQAMANIDYMMAPHERMARETQIRAGMTQAELLATPREITQDLSDPKNSGGDTTLQIINRALENGKGESGAFNSLMMSIGGLKNRSDSDSAVAEGLGRISLLNVVAHKAWQSIDSAKAVAITAKGWYLDEAGRVRLKNGRYILRGKNFDELAKTLTEKGVGVPMEMDEAYKINDSYVHEGSYTIEDLAKLADVVVESRMETTVGNELIDAILSPAFPATIKGDSLMGELAKVYVPSDDQAFASNLKAIEKVLANKEHLTLTKNDLANLIIFYHRTIGENFEQYGEGSNVYARGVNKLEMSSVPKERKVSAMRAIGDTSAGQNAIAMATGVPNSTMFNRTHASLNGERLRVKYGMGTFTFNANRIEFVHAEAPSWVRAYGTEAMEKWSQRAVLLGNRMLERLNQRVFVHNDEAAKVVDSLNARLANKLLILEPILDEALKAYTDTSEAGAGRTSHVENVNFAMKLMDEMFMMQERIAFGTLSPDTIFRYADKTIFDRVTSPISGSTLTNSQLERIAHKLGGVRDDLDTTGFGEIGSPNNRGRGYDAFRSMSNPHDTANEWAMRPMGMLSFLAGSIADSEEAQGISTSTAYSTFGVRSLGQPIGDTSLASLGFQDLSKDLPPIGPLGRHVEAATMPSDSTTSNPNYWGRLNEMLDTVKFAISTSKGERRILRDALEQFLSNAINENDQSTPESIKSGIRMAETEIRRQAKATQTEYKFEPYLKDLDVPKAKALLAQIDLEMSAIPREHDMLDVVSEIAKDASVLGIRNTKTGEIERAMAPSNMSYRYYAGQISTPLFPLEGTQGMNVGGIGLFNVTSFTSDVSAPHTYLMNGMSSGGIPYSVRSKHTNASHASEINLYNSLFANVVNNTTDGRVKGMANNNVKRLSLSHDVAMQLAEYASTLPQEMYQISTNVDSHSAYLFGGSLLSLYSVVREAAHKEGLSVMDYARSFNLLEQVKEGTPYAEVIPSPISGLSQKTESGIALHPAMLGVAAMFPLATVLNRGYAGWHSDGQLGLVVPKALTDANFRLLVDSAKQNANGVKGLIGNEGFRGYLTKFVESLTQDEINMLALECSSNTNSMTVANMLAFMNSWGLTKEETPRTIGNAKISEALSAGLASGIHYRVHGHPASPAKAGLSKEVVQRTTDFFKHSMKQESFWLAYFASLHEHNKSTTDDVVIPTAQDVNAGNGHICTRSTWNDSRGVGQVYAPLSKYRFATEDGHPVNALATFPMGQGVSFDTSRGDRSNITDNTFSWEQFKPSDETPDAIKAEDGGGDKSGISIRGTYHFSDAFGYGDYYSDPTGTLDDWNERNYHYCASELMNQTERGPRFYVYDDAQHKQMSIEKTEVPSSDVSTKQVLAPAAHFSRGLRRKLITNMIINAAEQMGVREVGVQPARFSASAKPDRMSVGLSSQSARRDLLVDNPLVLHTHAFAGKVVPTHQIRGGGFQGEVTQHGFCWQRLPDGRVMVNFTPHAGIHTSWDTSLSAKFNEVQPLGLNLRRTIGWDHTKEGLLIPQSFARQYGLYDFNESVEQYVRINGMPSRAQSIKILQNRLLSYAAMDPLYMEHAHIASARVAKNLDFGQNLTLHIADYDTRVPNPVPDVTKFVEEILGGATYAHDSDRQALATKMHSMSAVLGMNSPENSYYTFILPKDFNEGHIHEAISGIGLAHHQEYMGLTGLESREIYKSGNKIEARMNLKGDSYNPYTYNIHHDAIKTIISRANDARANSEYKGPSSFVLPYELSKDESPIGSADVGSRTLMDSTARFFATNQTRNPNFMGNIQSLHQRIMSQERGYFMPENERSVTTNGDRLAVIDAMFPNRPDLRAFAWDDSAKINLTVFRKSDKSGYVVGYDLVSGVDEAGIPLRRRMTRTFRTEGEANAHATEVASKSVLAEIPNIMAKEGTVMVKRIEAKPFAEASVFKKLNLTIPSDATELPFVQNENAYGVGNFNVTFPTSREAQAFATIAMTPEALVGQPKPRETIMMSTKGLSDLERDVRDNINFGTLGSPYQFGSNLMKAINSGLVRDRTGKKEFKGAYTGKDWYDLLVTNGTSKMELRTSGVVEYLYANKDNMISREEMAEFAATMYPRMGRQVLLGNGVQSMTLGHMVIPSSVTPSQLYNNSMGPYAGHLERVMELTKFNANGTHPEVFKAVQQAVVDAFKDAYAAIHGREAADAEFTTIEDVWDAFNRSKLGLRANNKISPQIAEIMRMGFNDFIAKAKIEHAAELAGLPLEMPDVLTGYDGPSSRPQYANLPTLAHAPTPEFTEGIGSGLMSQIRNTSPWAEYTSGNGPYSVDILSGHFHTKEAVARATKYIAAIDKRIQEAPLAILDVNEANKEIERLKNMRDAAKRVMGVREKLTHVGNITSGHWSSPSGSIQYGHARYTFGAASNIYLPLEPLHSLYGKFQTEMPMVPLLFIEEVQSDIYQKNTFGPSSRGELRLATDFKQAEQSHMFAELDQIKSRMAVLSRDTDSVASPMNRVYINHSQVVRSIHKMSTMREILGLTFVERHALLNLLTRFQKESRNGEYELLDNGSVMFHPKDYYGTAQHQPIDTGIRVDRSKTKKIPKEVSDKYGVSEDIPDVYISPRGAHYLAETLIEYQRRMDVANLSMPIHHDSGKYLAFEAALNAMGFSISDKIPNTGNTVDFSRFLIRPDGEHTQGKISMIALATAAFVDEGFQSSIREISKFAEKLDRTGHSFDFDALADRMLQRFKTKLNDPNTPPASRQALRMIVKDAETAMSMPASNFVMQGFERFSKSEDGQLMNNPFEGMSPSEVYSNPELLSRLMQTTYVLWHPTSEADPLANPHEYTAIKQKMVEMTPPKAYRAYAEHVKRMPLAKDMGQETRNMLVRTAEAIAKAYEDVSKGIDIGQDKWNEVHANLRNIWRDDDYWAGVNRPIHNATHDFGRYGNSPWFFDAVMVGDKSKSKTAAGKHLEQILSTMAVGLDRLMPTDELANLAKRKAEIEKVLQIDPDKADAKHYLPDSIPLGEDGTYRSIMMQFYAMRALQSQRNAIAFADARHHRDRYQSNGYVYSAMFVGPNMPIPMEGGRGSAPMGAIYILNEAAKHSPDGVLMAMATKGLHTLEPDFDYGSSTNPIITHPDGSRITLLDAAKAEVSKFMQEQMMPIGRSHDEMVKIVMQNMSRFLNQQIRIDSRSNSTDLKTYVKQYGPNGGLSVEQVGSTFNAHFSHEEGEGVHKRLAKMLPAPNSPFVSIPYYRTHGYTANYGTPKWNTSIYYSGMPMDFIHGLSNDAFERPLVAMAEDGTYTLSDPKTNKPIVSGVTQEQLQERIAQNSRYLGKSPMITPFIKAFGKAGAYVMDGSLFSNRNIDAVVSGEMFNALSDEAKQKTTAIKGTIGMQTQQTISPQIGGDVFGKMAESGNKYKNALGPLEEGLGSGERSTSIVPMGHPEGQAAPDALFFNASLHAAGLRVGASSDEIAAVMGRVGSFSSPVLVIKPKFPTANHIAEMRKILADGVPLMSVKGIGGEEGAVNGAVKGFRFYATPTQRRRDEQP